MVNQIFGHTYPFPLSRFGALGGGMMPALALTPFFGGFQWLKL